MAPRARAVEAAFVAVPVPIRTPRLVLRPPRAGDGAALADAMVESYDALHPWFHQAMAERRIETSTVWQEVVACRFQAQFAARERLPFLAWSGEILAAFAELKPDWRVGRMRLSYWVRSSMTQRGIGAEAVNALSRFAFGALKARLVTVGHAEPNAASARLIASLGFEPIARQPLGHEMPDGTLVDGLGYVLSGPDRLPDLAVSWGGGDPSGTFS